MIVNTVNLTIETLELKKGVDFKIYQKFELNGKVKETLTEECFFKYNNGVLFYKRKGLCLDGKFRETIEEKSIVFKELQKFFIKKYNIRLKR